MPASTIQDDVRGAIKTALASVSANVYDHVPEAPQVPAVVIVPDSPYMELELISKATTRLKLNYTVSAAVAYLSNPATLDNLEKLVIIPIRLLKLHFKRLLTGAYGVILPETLKGICIKNWRFK